MYFRSYLCMAILSTIGYFQFLIPLVLFYFYSLLNFKRVWSPVTRSWILLDLSLALVLDVISSRLYNYLASQSNHFGSWLLFRCRYCHQKEQKFFCWSKQTKKRVVIVMMVRDIMTHCHGTNYISIDHHITPIIWVLNHTLIWCGLWLQHWGVGRFQKRTRGKLEEIDIWKKERELVVSFQSWSGRKCQQCSEFR